MTDNELKSSWEKLKSSLGKRKEADRTEIRRMIESNRKTHIERLSRRYLIFSRLGLAMAMVNPIFILRSGFFGEYSGLLTILFVLYFATASSLDYWFYKGVGRLDTAMMPVGEIIRLSLYYRKRHFQSIALLLPLAILIIEFMIWTNVGDRIFVAGIISGAIIGIIIGSRQLIEFMDDYRAIMNNEIG